MFSILCLSAGTTPLYAQIGNSVRFDDTKGDRVVSAAHGKYKNFVTCCHTDDDRSCFLVEDLEHNIRKKFYSTAHVEPSMQYSCSGYIVNEMVVDDGYNCWFCGSKWERTGQYVYTIEGYLVPETLYCGYVGRFALADVKNGGGNMEIMIVGGSGNLQHFALTPSGGIYATEDNIIYHLTPSGGGGYNVVRGLINHNGVEKFMGVVCTGDTIVTLARCLNQGHFFYSRDNFYLNYGTTTNFITSNIALRYDVYSAYNNATLARMGMDTPIYLTATNKGSGVVVSYITESDDYPNYSFPGKLILFHFPYVHTNGLYPEILHNTDTGTYVRIKDIRSSDSVWGNPFLAALLEDNHGNSVWRLPIIGGAYNDFYDTVRKVQHPSMESIIPFRNPGISIHKSSLYLSGYYPFFQDRVARNISYNLRNDDSRGDKIPTGCYIASTGHWKADSCFYALGPDQYQHITIEHYDTGVASFEQIPIVSVDAPYTAICIDPVPVKDEQEN